MPEWLDQAFQTGRNLSVALLVTRLVAALVLGCVVAGVYALTRRVSKEVSSLAPTLVMLSVLISMVAMAVGDNQALAFSLVGALSIVRFRTVVEDTRDTAFVIFAVAVGMAIGAGYLLVAMIGIPVVAVAAFLFRARENGVGYSTLPTALTVRIGIGFDPETLLKQVFSKHLSTWKLISAATTRQGATLELIYGAQLLREDGVVALVAELNRVEGVQGTELRQI